MTTESPKKQIFPTQPKLGASSYQNFIKEIKNYTFNLNHHLNQAINDQNKSIKRKRYDLQKELQYLREKHFVQRKKLRQMEEFFQKYCENPLKQQINKWNQHQNYFQHIFEQYYHEVQIQNLINDKNRQKIALLRQEIKEKMRQDLKQAVTQRLQLYHLSKSKNFRTKKSFSTASQRKTTKNNTEPTQIEDLADFNFSKKLQRHTEADENQMKYLPCQTQQLVRSKTDMTLPSLKKSIFLDPERIKNDECNFMKPIGTVKKGQISESILPEIIRFLQEYKKKLQHSGQQMEWFQKVVFNNRNFDKLINKLDQQLKHISGKSPSIKHSNKVKQLVAKNLFRLKTQSTAVDNSQSKQIKNKQSKTRKRILTFVKKASKTERLMK